MRRNCTAVIVCSGQLTQKHCMRDQEPDPLNLSLQSYLTYAGSSEAPCPSVRMIEAIVFRNAPRSVSETPSSLPAFKNRGITTVRILEAASSQLGCLVFMTDLHFRSEGERLTGCRFIPLLQLPCHEKEAL